MVCSSGGFGDCELYVFDLFVECVIFWGIVGWDGWVWIYVDIVVVVGWEDDGKGGFDMFFVDLLVVDIKSYFVVFV